MLRRSGLWLPLLLVGAGLYWSTAMGLAKVSLTLLGAGSLELLPPHQTSPVLHTVIEEPILVRLQAAEGAEDEQPADAIRVDLQPACEHEDPSRDDGPGKTAF